jgi:probable addiction module antidote protein
MNAERFSMHDVADNLTTEEDIALFLEAVMEEAGDDPGFLVHALGIIARARHLNQLARDAGMSREALRQALSGEDKPSMDTVAKLAAALGIKLDVRSAA